MAKTNSNSITSILTVALNSSTTEFRRKMIELFEKTIQRKISDTIIFYDCTHTSLLYKEMKGKEVDIIARTPGVHKPVMMIEIKANIGETLQDSQKEGGEYQKTSTEHKIPLIYIIPKNYIHKNELPNKAKKIYWETILKHTDKISITFDTQINQFVEISEDDTCLSTEEKSLLQNNNLLVKIYEFKEKVLHILKEALESNKRNIDYREESPWGVGFYYSFKKQNYFIGFNPYFAENNNDNFFALDIQETSHNFELGDRKDNPLYFEEGYYYVPILKSKTFDGDEKVLMRIRSKFKELQIDSIDDNIQNSFSNFFSLQMKITDEVFKEIFKKSESGDYKYVIDERKYEKLKTKYLK